MPSKQGPRLYTRLSNFEHPKCDIYQTLSSHHFNHQLQLLLPCNNNCSNISQCVSELISSSPQPIFWITTAKLGALVQNLVTAEIFTNPRHQFSALSIADNPDSGHGVCLTAEGQLVIAVSHVFYQKLGLVGRKLGDGHDAVYHITIDLTAKNFKPGNHYFDKVVKQLNQELQPATLACIFNFNSQPLELTLPSCQSTKHITVVQSQQEFGSFQVPSLTRQVLDEFSGDAEDGLEWMSALHEWISAAACDLGEACDPLLPSGLQCETGKLYKLQWQGMLSARQVKAYLDAARQLMQERQLPWVVMNVSGFDGCPLPWTGIAHQPSSQPSIASGYSLLITPDNNYALFKPLASNHVPL